MTQFASGAVALAFAVAGLFFLRFWRDTRDRLFALFALAFFVLTLNRVGLALSEPAGGDRGDHFYWVRLCAFLIILAAVVDKNRSPRPPRP